MSTIAYVIPGYDYDATRRAIIHSMLARVMPAVRLFFGERSCAKIYNDKWGRTRLDFEIPDGYRGDFNHRDAITLLDDVFRNNT